MNPVDILLGPQPDAATETYSYAPLELQELGTFGKAKEYATSLAAKLDLENMIPRHQLKNEQAVVKHELTLLLTRLLQPAAPARPVFSTADIDRAVKALDNFINRVECSVVDPSKAESEGSRKKTKNKMAKMFQDGGIKGDDGAASENESDPNDDGNEGATKKAPRSKTEKKKKTKRVGQDNEIQQFTLEELDRLAEDKKIEEENERLRQEQEEAEREKVRKFQQDQEEKRKRQQQAAQAARQGPTLSQDAVLLSHAASTSAKRPGRPKKGGKSLHEGGSLW